MSKKWSSKYSPNIFVQGPLESFSSTLRTCSRYLKGPPNLDLCVSKKYRDHTTQQSDYMSGKVKKLRFWRNEAQNQVRIFWHNLFFWTETFFQRPLEILLLTLRAYSRYLKGPPNLAFCVKELFLLSPQKHWNDLSHQPPIPPISGKI